MNNQHFMIGTKPMETPARIEPCGIEEGTPPALGESMLELQERAQNLGRSLHPDAAAELRDMTKIMNAYYSNLIEGHNTRPRDIKAALDGRLDDVEDRPLALEAAAHVRVQSWIDGMLDLDQRIEPTSQAFIRDVHRRFYEGMPEEFLVMREGDRELEIVPGAYRAPGQEVVVGNHVPPSAERLEVFMAHFEMRYRGLTAGRLGRILSIPAAHHRLNYIHPFLDGNGRVSRLMSHAMVQAAGIHGRGLWSISRGLARGLDDPSEYKDRMQAADTPRQHDRDGRGNLSLDRLVSFSNWFLTVMIDQVRFSEAMFDLRGLEGRYTSLVSRLHPGKDRLTKLVSHVLRHGEVARGDVQFVLGVQERAARKDVSVLTEAGFLRSASPKGPLRIAFPLDYRETFFPNLFGTDEVNVPGPPDLPRL
ncbi:MAG: Fic family protein [Pseudomonadota bacterium]